MSLPHAPANLKNPPSPSGKMPGRIFEVTGVSRTRMPQRLNHDKFPLAENEHRGQRNAAEIAQEIAQLRRESADPRLVLRGSST